ncbi:hypothetical protein IC619_008610 [Hazenella sp. IB182353]|uniref:hypothetical protein n=1 Tax=Polycladospora coralii TaxID=2771432 RepID=UPI0017466A13|nr:hypothetical protein [Polycladospora coralii]MBS7530549.1 hypothetical protein [Polycladospora coralii]
MNITFSYQRVLKNLFISTFALAIVMVAFSSTAFADTRSLHGYYDRTTDEGNSISTWFNSTVNMNYWQNASVNGSSSAFAYGPYPDEIELSTKFQFIGFTLQIAAPSVVTLNQAEESATYKTKVTNRRENVQDYNNITVTGNVTGYKQAVYASFKYGGNFYNLSAEDSY